jgi:PKD repeat protein
MLLVQPRLFAQIHYIQSASNFSSSNASKLSASFTTNTTAGNTIVVGASTVGPVISSISDTQGNTYVQAVANGPNAIWYASNVKAGADTVTANFAASTTFSLIYVHEYSGLAPSPLDQTSSQTGTGTAVTSGAKITTQANELIFGYASVDHFTQSAGSGFSARQTAGGNMSEDMIVSTAGTYSASFTQNGSFAWTGLMATFKQVAPNPIYIQSNSNVAWTSASSVSASFTKSTTAGNTIVVAVSTVGPAVSSVSDSQGNIYAQAVSNGPDAIWYAGNIKAGTDAVTANFASSSGFGLIYIHEYAGLATNPLDQISSLTGTGMAVTSGAKTVTQGNELIFGYASVDHFVQSAGSGFSARQTAGGNMSEDMIVSTAGAYSANFTQNGSLGWTALMATFAGAAGGIGGGSAPKAVITANPTSGVAPLAVSFSGSGSTDTGGTITSYAWNFGDGQTSTVVSPSHIYAATGTYTASLTVTDSGGKQNSSTTTITASGPADPSIGVSISPRRAALTIGQKLGNLNAIVTKDNSNQGVTWSISPVGGGFTPGGSASGANVTLTAPSTAGVYTVTATSVTDVTKSDSITVAVTDLAGVYTYHNNLARNGANTQEYALTPAVVGSTAFGKLFSCTADGAIYAQPLWVANVTIGGVKHNVVYVATQHDGLFAFDADANPCVRLWNANLIDANHGGTTGETSVPDSLVQNVGVGGSDITPEIGVTGTPVIDPSTNTLYVVSKSSNASGTVFQRLHAIDITTGNEKFGGPANIGPSITYPGSGDGGTTVTFSTHYQNQRCGLALVNGTVYVVWASHGDILPYYGWVVSFNAATLAVKNVLNLSPNVQYGGIWMSGGAPAADSNGNLYVITGNATFDVTNASGPKNDYGDSALQLSPTLNINSYFAPSDESMDNAVDHDFGSGGATLIVNDASASPKHLLVGGGKDGTLYVLDGDTMGGFGDTKARQFFNIGSNVFATGAFWDNTYYIAGRGNLISYAFDPTSKMFGTTTFQSTTTYGFPGATPSVSATGSASNGIVWTLVTGSYCTSEAKSCGPAVLHANDATNVSHEIWNSSTASGDAAGYAVKFTVPTIANGKVYIGTRGNNIGGPDTSTSAPGELDVYGLKPN